MSEDQDLVKAVLARTPGAFERLVTRHQNLVWHMVYRVVQHPEDARDLCQDVFFRVHERLHQYRFESALSTWIVPPIISTSRLQMVRPRPVPPYLRVMEASAWENS